MPPRETLVCYDPGPFEAFASYDVIDYAKPTSAPPGAGNAMNGKRAIVGHFDIESAERRLPPEEKRDLSSAYPAKEKQREREQRRP